MPSKSKKQAKMMSAVAHNPEFAQKVGIPQSVGEEFNEADQVEKTEEVHKSNYGPKGAGLYDSTANAPRKIRNTGDIAGEGPNKTVKSYSSKPGQLSAKQQAAREMTPARVKRLSGPVTTPTLTEDDKARYLANLKKEDMLEIAPDGKQEIVDGKEPLKKEPKKKKKGIILPDGSGFFTAVVKNLPQERWEKLKKALDHNKAFMDLEEALGDDEEQQQMQPQDQEQQMQPQADDASALQQELSPQATQEEQGQVGTEDAANSVAVSAGQEDQEEPQPQEENLEEEGNGEVAPDPQELIDALREEGFSDQEIAYVMHGQHAAEVDESKAAKADATRAMSDIDIQNAQKHAELEHLHNEQSMAAEREHKKRMQDLEFEQAQKKHTLVDQDAAHKQRMADVEFEQAQKNNPAAMESAHKQRMLDLEYEKAKKESDKSDGSEDDAEANRQMKMLEVEKKKLELNLRKEEIKMELEFKKREHELKLKMMEAQLKEQAKQKGEILGIKHEQKLKEVQNPPKKPLKKSEEEDDEGRDQ